MDVIVQRVRTTWTKRSRGFPDATRRNALPVAFELPSRDLPLFHDVQMHEREDFAPRVDVVREVPPRHDVGLRIVGPTLQVRLPNGFGAPRRTHRPTVLLQPGAWVRWYLNNRGSSLFGENDWHYTLTVVSVAWGPVPLGTFLGDAPHTIDERAPLR